MSRDRGHGGLREWVAQTPSPAPHYGHTGAFSSATPMAKGQGVSLTANVWKRGKAKSGSRMGGSGVEMPAEDGCCCTAPLGGPFKTVLKGNRRKARIKLSSHPLCVDIE